MIKPRFKLTKLSFNTKINFNSNTISCRLFNAVENFCYLGGRSFSVLSTTKYQILSSSRSPKYRYRCHVQEKLDRPSKMMSTALKVILYATIVIPLIMFISKRLLRNNYIFDTKNWEKDYIFDTKNWEKEIDNIKDLQLKLRQICGSSIHGYSDRISQPVLTPINRDDPLLMSLPDFYISHGFIKSHTTPEAFKEFLRVNNLTNKKPRVVSFLMHAVECNNLPLVKYLVEEKSTIQKKALLVNEIFLRHSPTPLFFAKNVAMAKYLLDNGAEVNAETMGATTLENAISSKNDPLIRLFIQRGATLTPKIFFLSYWGVQRQESYDKEREELSTLCDIVSNKSFKLAVHHPDSIFSNLPIEIKCLIYSFYNV